MESADEGPEAGPEADSQEGPDGECTAGGPEQAVRFRARCPECGGGFELGPDDLRLAIGGSSKTTFYSFTCPDCGASVRKPAGERIVELLTDGGVRTMRLHTG